MAGKKTVTAPPRSRVKGSDGSTRERALSAAFAVFRKRAQAARISQTAEKGDEP